MKLLIFQKETLNDDWGWNREKFRSANPHRPLLKPHKVGSKIPTTLSMRSSRLASFITSDIRPKDRLSLYLQRLYGTRCRGCFDGIFARYRHHIWGVRRRNWRRCQSNVSSFGKIVRTQSLSCPGWPIIPSAPQWITDVSDRSMRLRKTVTSIKVRRMTAIQ